jgi:hypothetical protein
MKRVGLNPLAFTSFLSPSQTTFEWHQSRRHFEVSSIFGKFIHVVHHIDVSVPGTASEDLKASARGWIDKLVVKNGAYPPDSYPNPGM